MAVKLIAYECVADSHQPSLAHPDKLTIHDGAWSFCPFDARAEGHEWRETGGADLATVAQRFGLPQVAAVPVEVSSKRQLSAR